MDPQQLPKTSKFHSKSKKCDIEKTLGAWVPSTLGSPKVNFQATKLFIVTSATKWWWLPPPLRFRVRFKILYRVI